MSACDELRCDMPLPMAGANGWSFQTQDFEPAGPDLYWIRADGTLWREVSQTPQEAVWQPVPRLEGAVTFGTDYGPRNADGVGMGWVRFQATFLDGQVVGLSVVQHLPVPRTSAAAHSEQQAGS